MAKWYMLEGNVENLLSRLSGKVSAMSLTIQEPREIQGIVFPEEEFSRVRELLEENEEFEEVLTDREGVYLLYPKGYEVHFSGDEADGNWAKILPALRILCSRIMRDIVVVEKARFDPGLSYPEGALKVVFPQSNSNGDAKIETAFGLELKDNQKHTIDTAWEGLVLVDEDSNRLAELAGDTLKVLFTISINQARNPFGGSRSGSRFGSGTSVHPEEDCNTGEIMNRVTLWVERVLNDQTFATAQMQHQEALVLEVSRQAYIDLCKKRMDADVKATNKAIEEAQSQADQASKMLTEATRKGEDARRRLAWLQGQTGEETTRYEAEFEKLRELPDVKQVVVGVGNSDLRPGLGGTPVDKVIVYTDHLVTHLLSDGTQRDLGEFKIEIYANGGSPKVWNLTRQVDEKFHPHDTGGNKLCLGNIQEGIAQLTAEYEYSVVAQILIEFLQTINEEDQYGKRVWDWPIVGQEETKQPGRQGVVVDTSDFNDDDNNDDYYDDEEDD